MVKGNNINSFIPEDAKSKQIQLHQSLVFDLDALWPG